uniref:Integrase catalytic domain-containing protein n=1 Tax=Phytophthora ramorum TaxID=164328 RepID=H3H9E8_PHYRM
MRGEIDCKAPGLQVLREKAMGRLKAWPTHDLLHVKRDWNQSADRLASTALQREAGAIVSAEGEIDDLIAINRLGEVLKTANDDSIVQVTAVTRSARRTRQVSASLQETIVQRMRSERIARAQNEEKWIGDLKAYLRGDVADLSSKDARLCAKIAGDYDVGEGDLLFYCGNMTRTDENRDSMARLVVPATLHQDFLHHYHASLEGGHQGIGRTYQRIKAHFHWRGLFKSVQRFVGECLDCETGKGRPVVQGESPGNVQATYPFQIIAMDHIPSLPKSFKGNTELLVWVDLFSGYVIAKASASRTAQTIAENYEECVFRRFGASEAIRHDREPGFMSDFFRAFNRIMGQRQRATMAYRPQANGTAERMVQTLTRA